MATANASTASGDGSGGDNGFWSTFTNILQTGQQVLNQTAPIWNHRLGSNPGGIGQTTPSFQGTPGSPTSGSNVSGPVATNYMPFIIGGGVLLVALFLLKK